MTQGRVRSVFLETQKTNQTNGLKNYQTISYLEILAKIRADLLVKKVDTLTEIRYFGSLKYLVLKR